MVNDASIYLAGGTPLADVLEIDGPADTSSGGACERSPDQRGQRANAAAPM